MLTVQGGFHHFTEILGRRFPVNHRLHIHVGRSAKAIPMKILAILRDYTEE
jgi:hypothetical protein